MKNRVVMSAAGIVSPLGSGLGEFFAALHAACIGVDHISSFDARCLPTDFGAEARHRGTVLNFDEGVDRKERFLHAAMEELCAHADLQRYEPEQRFLSLGAGIDHFDFLAYVRQAHSSSWKDYSAPSCRTVQKLAEAFSFRGGHCANLSACVASSQALGFALRLLRCRPEMAVVGGGFDSMLSYLHYMGFYHLGALSDWEGTASGACRPFDRHRHGLVIGEGAAVFLLENEAHADPERILCRLSGYASTMDAYMVTDPDPSGTRLAEAALLAIRDAGLTPDDIDSVDLHGTGTVKNALAETRALEIVFPKRYREIPVFALKGQIGHLIGACGAVEVLGAIDALQQQRLLPSVNCDEPDPEVPLNIIRGAPQPMRLRHILKINAAFGGQNTALVLSAYD
jgi:3-oxoacyl-[acyl-carrier-protein] synthase II